MTTRQKSEFEKSLIEALKSDNVVKEISDAIINTISRKFAEKFDIYEAKIATLESEIQALKSGAEKNENDENTRKKLERKVDYLEQRTKNKNIRLIGIRESHEENVLTQVKKLFQDKLNVSVVDEITSVYRTGATDKKNSRHLIVVFRNTEFKNIIFKKKKLHKGSNIVMKEDLTHVRWKLVRESSETYGFNNVWTSNGAVFVRSEMGVKKLISGPAPQPPNRRRNPPSELMIPCEFCDTPIHHKELIQHQSGCRPDLFSRPPRRPLDFDFDDDYDLPRHLPLVREFRTSAPEPPRRQKAPKAELLIPCEFCDEPVAENDLIRHQTGCRPDLARRDATEEDAATPEVELPCEFCEDMFPASKLNVHQAGCMI